MTARTNGRRALHTAMEILGIGTGGRTGNSTAVLLILGLVLSFGASGAHAQCTATGSNSINWTDTSGNWSLASNWNLGCTPNNGTPSGTSYNVTINGTGSDTVTLDISPTVNGLTLGTGETLQLSSPAGVALNDLGSFGNSGSLTFSATSVGSTVTTGAFTNNSGAQVNMNGQGDTLTATSFTNSGAIIVTGQVCCGGLASETLNDSGDFSNNSGGSLDFSAGSVFNQATVDGAFTNNAGANLNMLGNEDTLSVGSFTNSGTVTMAGAVEALNDSGDFTNNATGLVTVGGGGDLSVNGAFTNTGMVVLNGGGSGVFATSFANSGAINLNGNDDLLGAEGGAFDNTGSVTFGSGSNFSEVYGASIFTNENGATVSINGANDILTAGSFVNSGGLTLNGSAAYVQLSGDFTNNSTGVLTFGPLSSGGTLFFVSGTLANNGGAVTMDGNGDGLYAGSYTNTGAILLNGADETLGSETPTTTFANELGGTITFSSGSTDNTVSMSGAFTNDRNSTVTMNGTGDLLYGSSLTNSGAIVIGGNMETLGASGTGDVTNNLVGTITFGSGSTGSFVGTNGSFTNAGTLMMNGKGDQVSGGSFTNSGVISIGGNLETLVSTSGAFTNSGSLTFTSTSTGSYAETASAFANSGTITMNGTGDEVGGGSFTNTGVISIGGNTETLVSSTGDFTNNGKLTFTSTSTGSNAGTFGGAFTNAGTIAMNGAGDTLSAGSFTNSGSVSVGATETLNAVGGYLQNVVGATTDISGTLTTSSYTEDQGSTTIERGGQLDATTVVIQSVSTLTVLGTLDPTSVSVGGGATLQGTGTIQGSVSMTGGTIMAGVTGGAGMLTINGSFSQSGAIFDELIGPTGNGLLTVGGPLTLGSSDTLNIDLLSGLTLSDDKSFDILNYTGGESGAFVNAAPGEFDMDGWMWDIDYDYDGSDEVVLEALAPEPAPEPSELLLLVTGLLALGAFCQRKRIGVRR